MKSLTVTGILGEMLRKGTTKHCCDQGLGVFEVKFVVNL